MDDVRLRVGRNIRKIRMMRGYSQEQLADLAGLHFTYISSVERGQRNISIVNVEKIAKALAVETQRLLAK
jgi:transcriptional regulator with XRE-family HTH domain